MKLFEYAVESHRTTETLRVNECSQGLYIGVNRQPKFPALYGDEEQTTSIVVPLSEVPELIESLTKVPGRWIKASEQLPTHEQHCVVYRYNDNDGATCEYSIYLAHEHLKGFGDCVNGEDFLTDVIYWMPLDLSGVMAEMEKELNHGK